MLVYIWLSLPKLNIYKQLLFLFFILRSFSFLLESLVIAEKYSSI